MWHTKWTVQKWHWEPAEWTSNGSVIFYHFRDFKQKKKKEKKAHCSTVKGVYQRAPHMVRM